MKRVLRSLMVADFPMCLEEIHCMVLQKFTIQGFDECLGNVSNNILSKMHGTQVLQKFKQVVSSGFKENWSEVETIKEGWLPSENGLNGISEPILNFGGRIRHPPKFLVEQTWRLTKDTGGWR